MAFSILHLSFLSALSLVILTCRPIPVELKPAADPLSKPSVIKADEQRYPLMRSLDGGLNWAPFGQGIPQEARISYLDILAGELIVGTEEHGLYLSSHGKSSWNQIGGGLPGMKITALTISGQSIFAAVYQRGVYYSPDAGQSWISLNENLPDHKVLGLLYYQNHLIAASDSGIYTSTGTNGDWKQTFSGHQAVSIHQENGDIIAGTTGGVLLSRNRGLSWVWVHQKGAIHNTAYENGLIAAMYISNDIYCSSDLGRTWTQGQYSPKAGSYIYEVIAVQDHLLMANNYGAFRSLDQGLNWVQIYPRKPFIFFDFLEENGVLYAGTRENNE